MSNFNLDTIEVLTEYTYNGTEIDYTESIYTIPMFEILSIVILIWLFLKGFKFFYRTIWK